MIEQLITPEEVYQKLGISKEAQAQWRCHKDCPMPYVIVGRGIRYKPSELCIWIARINDKGIEL